MSHQGGLKEGDKTLSGHLFSTSRCIPTQFTVEKFEDVYLQQELKVILQKLAKIEKLQQNQKNIAL